jgi:hypothetical protein
MNNFFKGFYLAFPVVRVGAIGPGIYFLKSRKFPKFFMVGETPTDAMKFSLCKK